MEAFFKNDQEIREWVDLFVEKLVTVNLLSGSEADAEFYQGRQLVEKIAASFQEMFDLPKEVLIDGIHQLVEQRLPDHRVIENFPDFYQLMNDMINAGLQNVGTIEPGYFPQQIIGLKTLNNKVAMNAPSSKVSLNGGGVLTKELDSSFSLRQHLLKAMDSVQISNDPMDSSMEEKQKDSDHNNKLCNTSNYILPTTVQGEVGKNTREMDEAIDKAAEPVEEMDNVLYLEPNLNEDSYPLAPISKSLHELIDESMKQLLQESRSVIDEYTLAYTQDPLPSALEEGVPGALDLCPSTQIEEHEEILEEAVSALSLATVIKEDAQLTKNYEFLRPRDPFRFNKPKRNSNEGVAKQTSQQLSSSLSLSTPQEETPQEGKALAYILNQLYGDTLIQWNVTIDQHNFFAKVNNLLINVVPSNSGPSPDSLKFIETKMKKSGYKVLTCCQEDLAFPRRLERSIRRVR